MNVGPKYRKLSRALGVAPGALEAFGVRPTDSADEAKDRIIAALGLPAWRAAQRANAGPARGAALLSAKRVVHRADEDLGDHDDGDEPCAMCEHDRAEHPDDGPCTHAGCECDEYTSEDEARMADEPPPSRRQGRTLPDRREAPAPRPPTPDERLLAQMQARSTANPERLRAALSALRFGQRHAPPTRAQLRRAAGFNPDRLDASERALIAAGVLPPKGAA